jgi:hypothetical protein
MGAMFKLVQTKLSLQAVLTKCHNKTMEYDTREQGIHMT